MRLRNDRLIFWDSAAAGSNAPQAYSRASGDSTTISVFRSRPSTGADWQDFSVTQRGFFDDRKEHAKPHKIRSQENTGRRNSRGYFHNRTFDPTTG